MMKFASLVLLAAVSGPVDTPRHTWPAPAAIQQPPAKWSTKPAPKMKVVYADNARAKCSTLLSAQKMPHEVWGCAGPQKGLCLVILQSGMPPDLEAAVLSHEIGHCKGWPPDHPLK